MLANLVVSGYADLDLEKKKVSSRKNNFDGFCRKINVVLILLFDPAICHLLFGF